MTRTSLLTCTLAAVCLASSLAMAQEGGQHEVLRAADGFPIHITYYPFAESKDNPDVVKMNAPVVVLIPGDNESRLHWDKASAPRGQDPFPILLQKRGFAVVTVDLRKHGESIIEGQDEPIQANDYQAMVAGDMLAVKEFLYKEHQAQNLNMAKLGLVGVGTGAPIAAAFAQYDWSLRPYDDAPRAAERTPRGQTPKVLVLVTPESTAGRVRATTSLNFLRSPIFNIALQVIVGADDSRSNQNDAEQMFEIFENLDKQGNRSEFLSPNFKDRGIAAMRVPIVYASVLKFLETHLKALDIPWQDRRSRLER